MAAGEKKWYKVMEKDGINIILAGAHAAPGVLIPLPNALKYHYKEGETYTALPYTMGFFIFKNVDNAVNFCYKMNHAGHPAGYKVNYVVREVEVLDKPFERTYVGSPYFTREGGGWIGKELTEKIYKKQLKEPVLAPEGTYTCSKIKIGSKL